LPASEPLIRDISDTARWVAAFRARESERPDAVFRDPFARRLAGERGERIAASPLFSNRNAWAATVARTYLFDLFIGEQIKQGTDLIVNLAAGLDARPYRLSLPQSLRWVEIDLPGILAYKEEILRGERPLCSLERVPLDLSDERGRRDLFGRADLKARSALVISEGLLIYLTAEQVGSLAVDLASASGFDRWVVDVVSPGLLRLLQRTVGSQLVQGGASFKFGPPQGPQFFAEYGWLPIEVRSMFKTAAQLKRLSPLMRLLAALPENKGAQSNRPWSAVCLLGKSGTL